VRLDGATGERHRLVVNGRIVPLRATGREGEYVAGIRYRAWQPARGMHPTLPVDAPLVFDLYDTWSERAIGGCAYHVAHPGGRNSEVFPVNAYEAEGRRLARFEPFGFTGGMFDTAREEANPDFPYTLDLRRGV